MLMRRKPTQTQDVRPAVERLLREALMRRASDVHLEPTTDGVEVRQRVDGMLATVAKLDHATGQAYVNRLMVMAELLTYRRGVPQEGGASVHVAGVKRAVELRVSVMPTTHGLRAVVRLPAGLVQPGSLDALDLPAGAMEMLERYVERESGMLVVCGPAGSGKTTTIYALLERIAEQGEGLSIISLEDPVERDVAGVTQIEVQPFGELTYDKVLRSILRQDPQVLALGEIRDRETASMAVQAAMSGHRLIATLHASRPEGAVVRLLEMGIEPYQLVSSLAGIMAMRLLRRGTEAQGYEGRIPVVECAELDDAVRRAILNESDGETIRSAMAQQKTFEPFGDGARWLIEAEVTDPVEARRVLGAQWRSEGP